MQIKCKQLKNYSKTRRFKFTTKQHLITLDKKIALLNRNRPCCCPQLYSGCRAPAAARLRKMSSRVCISSASSRSRSLGKDDDLDDDAQREREADVAWKSSRRPWKVVDWASLKE
jgi:hypothetical protein